ncbi:GNAT family N-acetyltransferase [Herbaspirillum sp. C7C8]|uniref:GNAT family N-acetyltransferase n=1 Tax=Herbaspirillum sp. C7C8 TaxID=2736665 RepID=UPI001F5280F9|nr:GNAT family N-acetyltransferase [Herbaspirillum sp. C7C8]MCI1005209.1 GNAT family N-acetyltransferase [Herbaspirillum sp. C7C8]
MGIEIKRCAIADIVAAPELPALLAEYGAESGNEGIGPVNPQFDTYLAMETAGMLHALSARLENGQLVGFMLVLTPVLPHFGRRVAVSESFFVATAHRSTGAGLRLLRAAECLARDAGAVGIMVSAPNGGQLAQVLPGMGYHDASHVFFKGLA